jgi:hypothetical protein
VTYFHARPELARNLVEQIAGRNFFSSATNGLFLAAPRRTGKSMFLQHDLRPALEKEGVIVIYVDLWANKERDPGDLIAERIAAEVSKNLGVVARAAKESQITGIGSWLKIDTSKIGKIDGMTLADALRTLHDMSGKPIALIIDEAQHALTSAQGDTAMTALKSARDQLNSPEQTNLMLVMSGSDRDKLMRLVNSNAAPFFGSTITTMPALGLDYVEALARQVETGNPALKPVNVEKLWQAFQRYRHRPEPFGSALRFLANPLNDPPPGPGFEDGLLTMSDEWRQDQQGTMESAFLGLRPIEQAVLWRMLEQESKFRPYDADALAFYKARLNKKITAQQVQNALDQLREQSPVLAWRSARKEYSLEDTAMYEWYKLRVAQGTWPPQDPSGDPEGQDVPDGAANGDGADAQG